MSRPTDCWVSRSFSVWLFLPSTKTSVGPCQVFTVKHKISLLLTPSSTFKSSSRMDFWAGLGSSSALGKHPHPQEPTHLPLAWYCNSLLGTCVSTACGWSRGEKKFFRIQQGCSYLTKEFNSFSAGAGFHKPICCSCTLKDLLAVLSSSRMFEAPSNSSTVNQSLKKLITNIFIKLWWGIRRTIFILQINRILEEGKNEK